MDLSNLCSWTTMVLLMLLKEVNSLPFGGTFPVSQFNSEKESTETLPRREKRCSCENVRDIECVYFCHIGIIWVYTAGQVVPYGIGNPNKRRRRDIGKCLCVDSRDVECLHFCQPPSQLEKYSNQVKPMKLFSSLTKTQKS
ncbi:endothelin-1-like [Protopterus annectens]|uniref:endothelin-1-like n=1 Tax=Protopterus annectens TaxID=7888 RepID=UPI001CF9A3E8|nr:endothelin-1-like [Protopterus annectens]